MESLVALLLLLVTAGGLVYAQLRGRLDKAEKRLREIDLELYRLRREGRAGDELPTEAPSVMDAAELEDAGAADDLAAAPPPIPPPAPPEDGPTAPAQAVEADPGTMPLPAEEEARPTAAAAISSRQTLSEATPPPEVGEESAAAEVPLSESQAGAEEPPLPPAKPPAKTLQLDWERWIGVRGAAVLGGAVLALAAILFLKFSIERGLIPPVVRVTLGLAAGLAAIGGAELLRKRAYGATANSLSGAGTVILYASIWAAHRLYELVPVPIAFALLLLVTATCGLLSWRHRALVIALLGLVGGFATPFMLASDRVNPIGLFGYILLLDVGLLVLAGNRRWPMLSHLALAGTVLYQALWIFGEVDAERFLLTLVILGVFALLFALTGGLGRPAEAELRQRRITLVGGITMPFGFAAYLAARADLSEHLLPIAGLLLLLSAAACWMGRVHRLPLMAPGAAAASVAAVAVWAARTELTQPTVWELIAVTAGLAALFRFFPGNTRDGTLVAATGFLLVLLGAAVVAPTGHLWPWLVGWLVLSSLIARQAATGDGWRWFLAPAAAAAQVVAVGAWLVQRSIDTPLAWEIVGVAVALAAFYHYLAPEPSDKEPRLFLLDAVGSSPFVAAAGLFWLLSVAPLAARASGLWPWLVGWVALAALLVARGRAAVWGYRQIVAAGLFGFSFLLHYLARGHFDTPPRAAVLIGLAMAVAVAFQGLALRRRASGSGRKAEVAAALYPMILLFALMADPSHGYLPDGLFLAVALFLAGMVALSATRLPNGGLYLAAVVVLALVHSFWAIGADARDPAAVAAALGVQVAAVLLCAFWPFIAGRRLAGSRWALYGSALAGPLWFLSLRRLFELRFGDGAIGVLPLALAVVALLAALAGRRLWVGSGPERRRSQVWYLAVTFAFVSVAIPLQLEKEWITVGWALEGLALITLWKRLDHPGLKYLGLGLLAAVTARLIINPAVFAYYPRSGRPIFNWLMYTYLVPGAALLLSSRALGGLEVDRWLGWERSLYGIVGRRPAGAIACGLAAILVGFWWINLTVIDYFSLGGQLDLSFDRLPARDLSLSLSWALYALILLATGMARRSVGLRWLSLGFLVLTIGKVFLYDLGELKDLYRVASLVGLAVSLLLVSLAYQRFVFGRDDDEEEP